MENKCKGCNSYLPNDQTVCRAGVLLHIRRWKHDNTRPM